MPIMSTDGGLLGKGPAPKNIPKKPDSFKKNLEKQNSANTRMATGSISKPFTGNTKKIPAGSEFSKKNFQKGLF